MSAEFTLALATLGSGLWVTRDGARTWQLAELDLDGAERTFRAVQASPTTPGTVWAASESDVSGDLLHLSHDGGRSYHLVDTAVGDRQITCIAPSPHDADFLLLGTCPGGVLRSRDAGKSWEELDFPCGALALDLSWPRQRHRVDRQQVLRLAYTEIPGEIWAAVEIGGLWHTTDHGDTWTQVALSGGEQLLGPDEVVPAPRLLDIHDVLPTHWSGTAQLSVANPLGFFHTADAGSTWTAGRYASDAGFEAAAYYTRTLLAPARTDFEVLAGIGRQPMEHGTMGGIVRSTDGGLSWRAVSPVLRSVVWAMSAHPQVPGIVAATALYGQVLLSTDDGRSWEPTDREFGEIRAVAVVTTP